MTETALFEAIKAYAPGVSNERVEEIIQELADSEPPVPDVIFFKYYLHDSYSRGEFQEFLTEQTGFAISDELMEKIGRPFNEVGFNCELNTITGEVKILGPE